MQDAKLNTPPGGPRTRYAGLLTLAALAWSAGALAWARGSQYMVDYEMALLPWLAGRGWVFYRDLAEQHPPLWPALLARLAAGGDPGRPLHLVTLGLYGLSLVLAFAVGRRAGGAGAGLAAVILASAWLVVFDGLHLWYDGALAPLYLVVAWLLLQLPGAGPPGAPGARWQARLAPLALGALLGIGMLIKQHAVVAVPGVALALGLAGPGAARRLAAFAAGLGVPLLLAGAVFALQGALAGAWYWIVAYSLNGDYATRAALTPGPHEWDLLEALYLLLPALALVGVATAARRGPAAPRAAWAPRLGTGLALAGLLVAATLPIWPRYGRYHLDAAIPLLAVAGGVAGAGGLQAVRRAGGWRRATALAGLVLVAWSGWVAGSGWAAEAQWQASRGPVAAPYAATAPPLRAWIDAHAPPGAPIFVYDLDALLYRVLEREPPRPWAPQLPWIFAARDTEAQLWAGVARARPPVALVPDTGWAASPAPGQESGEARLRYDYHEAARFAVVAYAPAPPVTVVVLLRNDAAGR